MKRFALYLGMVTTALVASCSIQEKDFRTPQQDDVIYYASFEQPAEEGTRVYANEDLLLRWTADDRVSIFGKNTFNQQYKFLGETGDNSGGFSKVDGAEYVTGNPISHTISVYPYQEGTKISEEEVLTLTLPAEQHYAENTFGLGANSMVSVSSDNVLQYKNVGGFLRISLYGAGVSVSSITLKGNNGEKLAGKASVTMPLDGVPAVDMMDEAIDEITLVCDTPVALGATAEKSVDFWFVVPPMVFNNGFRITVNIATGGSIDKLTSNRISIQRNMLSKMTPIELETTEMYSFLEVTPSSLGITKEEQNFEISVEGNVEYDVIIPDDAKNWLSVQTDESTASKIIFSAKENQSGIVREASVSITQKGGSMTRSIFISQTDEDAVYSVNEAGTSFLTYKNLIFRVRSIEEMTLVFDGFVETCPSELDIPAYISYKGRLFTVVSFRSFTSQTNLEVITIPNTVSEVPITFDGCSNLRKMIIKDGENGIRLNRKMFDNCSIKEIYLGRNVILGGGVSSEYIYQTSPFSGKSSITSFVCSNYVTDIGGSFLRGCSSLSNLVLSDSITKIGSYAFANSGIKEIVLPSSLTKVGEWFLAYSSVEKITVPESLKQLAPYSFGYCEHLNEITIYGLERIPSSTFYDCSRLRTIYCYVSTPPVFYEHDGCSPFSSSVCIEGTLYVPKEAINAYQLADGWKNIWTITPIP